MHTGTGGSAPESRRRRSPAPDERQVDAERSRRALLEAALDEFAAKGFAGARVRDIAERAGLSKDLINYHFGGKEGLYREVQRCWLRRENAFHDPDLPIGEIVVRYLHDAVCDPRPMRLLAWRGLAEDGPEPPDVRPETEDLSAVRLRQDRGELIADLDPAVFRLVFLGAIAAPVVMPHMARRIFGLDPGTPEFEARYGDGLRRLLGCLAPSPPSPLSSPGESTGEGGAEDT